MLAPRQMIQEGHKSSQGRADAKKDYTDVCHSIAAEVCTSKGDRVHGKLALSLVCSLELGLELEVK